MEFVCHGGLHTCKSGHSMCLDCLKQYLRVELDKALPVRCHGTGVGMRCSEVLQASDLRARHPNFDDVLLRRLERHEARLRDHRLMPCPHCDANVRRPRGRSNTSATCGECHKTFCFVHGLDHVGEACPDAGQGFLERTANGWWRFRHTRKCPSCGHGIERNGGCNHMTCRCGFELCWRCGKPWEYGAHMGDLFPSPRQLRSCCNTPKLWAQRCAAVCLAAPVAALVIAATPVVASVKTVAWIKQKVTGDRKEPFVFEEARRPYEDVLPRLVALQDEQDPARQAVLLAQLTQLLRAAPVYDMEEDSDDGENEYDFGNHSHHQRQWQQQQQDSDSAIYVDINDFDALRGPVSLPVDHVDQKQTERYGSGRAMRGSTRQRASVRRRRSSTDSSSNSSSSRGSSGYPLTRRNGMRHRARRGALTCTPSFENLPLPDPASDVAPKHTLIVASV